MELLRRARRRYEEVIAAIRKESAKIIILPSTQVELLKWTAKERLQPVFLSPEIATLDCGTCNFYEDDVFTNTVNMVIPATTYERSTR